MQIIHSNKYLCRQGKYVYQVVPRITLGCDWYINGLLQERRNSIANAMELSLSCTNPLTCTCVPEAVIKGRDNSLHPTDTVGWNYLSLPLISASESQILIWVRSQNCGCIVTWFCYQLIAKPGNKTAAVLWPDPYVKQTVFVITMVVSPTTKCWLDTDYSAKWVTSCSRVQWVYHQAPSHNLNPYWPRFATQYGI